MGYTISTHNGSSVRRAHNNRTPSVVRKEKHIDLTKPHENWRDIGVRQAYENLFGDAVREYNDRQKRDDRKITDYYQSVRDDAKKHPVYEMIVGVYKGSEDSAPDPETCRSILREFAEDWHKRNPQLQMIGCYYHADERGKAPHLHIDYIPWSESYSRGMSRQSGLNRALKDQGIVVQRGSKQTPQMAWQANENAALERICNEHGLEIEHPERGENVRHLATPEYQRLQDELASIRETSEKLSTQLCITREEVDALQRVRGILDTAKVSEIQTKSVAFHKDEVIVDRGDLDRLLQTAAAHASINNHFARQHQQLRQQEAAIAREAERLDYRVREYEHALHQIADHVPELRDYCEKSIKAGRTLDDNDRVSAYRSARNIWTPEEQQATHERSRNHSKGLSR